MAATRKTGALLALFIALLFLSGFIDLPLEEALYHPDALGRFIARFGEAPGYLLLLVCVLLFVVSSLKIRAGKTLSGSVDFRAMRRAALAGVCFIVVSLALVHVLKLAWGRQRFATMTTPGLQFTPWYKPQGFGRSINGSRNACKSFPSGHAANAALFIWLTLLPDFLLKLRAKKWRVLLMLLALAWVVLVWVCRIRMGAHFMSDVVVGSGLSWACFCLARRAFNMLQCDKGGTDEQH